MPYNMANYKFSLRVYKVMCKKKLVYYSKTFFVNTEGLFL
jgi:hypothetical protein